MDEKKNSQETVSNKIVVGLQRISEAFKVLLWEKAKEFGLSPIQIQILIFIENHKKEYCNVSYLAKEFNLTKPTISDAIKALEKKEMIIKDYSSSDNRSYTIFLSDLGKNAVFNNKNFTNPILTEIENISSQKQEDLFETMSSLIYSLNKKGILTVQRTCFACKFYSKNNNQHHCNLLKKELSSADIRLDCNEFENIL
jgi:DNA-binding MarR family transcriptional regulator